MKKVLLVIVAAVAALSLNAQRTVDMSTSIDNPKTNDVITSGVPFNLNFTVTNNGPDVMKTGDTIIGFLVLGTSVQQQTGVLWVLTTDLAVSGTRSYSIPNLTVSGGTSGSAQVCALALLSQKGGTDTVADLRLGGNNVACATVQYSATNSVGEELTVNKLTASVYPNPVSNEGTISFQTHTSGNVTVKILDITGREVATVFEGTKDAGSHTVNFDASALKAGVYFYQLSVGESVITNKIVVSK
jgi:hypothetical protein